MKTIMFGTGVLFVLVCAAGSSFAADWPQYHGPNQDRVSLESGWTSEWEGEGPEIIWRKRLGVGYGSFAVVGDHVYAAGYDKDMGEDVIYCFDVATGEEVWRFSYPCAIYDNLHAGGPTATPNVNDGHLYMVSKEGHVHCLDAKTGEKVWMVDVREELDAEVPTWGFSGAVLIDGDHAIVDVGVIAAFDKKSGELVWKTDENYGSAYATPILAELDGKDHVIAVPEYGIVIVDADTGEFVAKHRWETSYGVNAATPIVHDDYVFISTGYNKGSLLVQYNSTETPDVIWEDNVLRTQMNAAVLYEGHLYGFDETELVCVDFMTGEEQWRQKGLGKGSLMIADGKLVVQGEKGELVIADANPEAFEPTGRKQILGGTNWTCPVLSNGHLFARNARGDMAVLNMSAE